MKLVYIPVAISTSEKDQPSLCCGTYNSTAVLELYKL